MSGVSEEAVNAAAQAWEEVRTRNHRTHKPYTDQRTAFMAGWVAALPLIEANLRAKLRAEIEAMGTKFRDKSDWTHGYDEGIRLAAAIVGGEAEE